jgi:hypothetical protein
VTWTLQPNGVIEDYRSSSSSKKNFSLSWYGGTTGGSEPIDFFRLLFPYSIIPSSLTATHRNYDAAAVSQIHRVSDDDDVFRMLGVILLMSTVPLGDYKRYWNCEEKQDGMIRVTTPPAFGSRLGIPRVKYEHFITHFQYGDWTDEEVTEDPWRAISTLVSGFNETREKHVNPGDYICVDESMSVWTGSENKYRGHGHPSVIKIPAKPVGVGTEIKASACGESGVLLRIEPNQGKSWSESLLRDMTLTHPGLTNKSSACTLRLVQPWFSSGRIVCGDSWFASVETAVFLRKNGLHFTGLVKGSSKYFPKKYLNNFNHPTRGDTATLTATKDGVPLIAHSWSDRKLKCFVSTCGTTLPGEPAWKRRYHRLAFIGRHSSGADEIRYKAVPRTKLIEKYFACSSAVDIHNHNRQGSIALEDLDTKKWWWRLSLTILGMIVTDCFLAYRASFPRATVSLSDFVVKLANQLIFKSNNPRRSLTSSSSSSADQLREQYGGTVHEVLTSHNLRPLNTHPFYIKKSAQSNNRAVYNRACSVCKKPAYYYCESDTCTLNSADSAKITALCGSTHPCLAHHVSEMIHR